MLFGIKWAILGGICLSVVGQSVVFLLMEGGEWVFQKDLSGYRESQGSQEIHDRCLVSRTGL